MKNKTFIFISGVAVGFLLNTTTGKKLRTWALSVSQDCINKVVGKVNKITTIKPSFSQEEEGTAHE